MTDCSELLSLRSCRSMLVKADILQAGQARAKPRLTWTRQRPLEDSKGDQFWGASESLVTSAMDAAERGMATFAGITYSPCTSYLHHRAMTLATILTPRHATPGGSDSLQASHCVHALSTFASRCINVQIPAQLRFRSQACSQSH